MNKLLNSFFCFIITLFLTAFVTICFYMEKSYSLPQYYYQVYLDGEKIGRIDSKDELYEMINKEQKEIKEQYNINQVYPPKGFKIIKTLTYNEDLSTIESVYNKIKEAKDFTVKGYTITIKKDKTEPIYIYVLNENIFKEAVTNIVNTFIGEERYNQYLNNNQPEIIDTGFIIEQMYFDNKISIKESLLSVSDKIYTNTEDLTKYLLFGDKNVTKEYTVVQGDTISSIAEANRLNTSELLLANNNLKSEDTLLAIGQKLNVTLIDPVLNFIYEELVVSDVEEYYKTEYIEDNTKYVGYKKVKTKGVNGINRVTTRIQYQNGAPNSGAAKVGTPIVIKSVQNEVIIKGTKKSSVPADNIRGHQFDNGEVWAWPTNSGYIITSGFGWRWGVHHDGIDISGTGAGSPIYASLDGEVVNAQFGGFVGGNAGCNVVLKHNNGYYTVYAHLKGSNAKKTCSMIVSVGQKVVRGQKIGLMGKTGTATGVHLHFGLFYGKPYSSGSKKINPMTLWKK